jgi:hypothetical protein
MVSNILRLAGAATIFLLGGLILILWRLDRSVASRDNKAATKTRYAQ